MQRAWQRSLRKQGWKNPFHSTATASLIHMSKQNMSTQPSSSTSSSQQQNISQEKATLVGSTVKSLNMNNPPLDATPQQQAEYIKLVQQKEKNRTKLNWLLAFGVSSIVGSVLLRNYWEEKIKEEEEAKIEEAAQKLRQIALKKKQDELDNLTKEEEAQIVKFEQKLKEDEQIRSKYTPSEQQLEQILDNTVVQKKNIVEETIKNIVAPFSNVQVVTEEPVVVVPSAALAAEQVDSEELNTLRTDNQKLEAEIQRLTTLLQENEQKVQKAIQEKIREIEQFQMKMEQDYKGKESDLMGQLEQERQKLLQAEQEMFKAKELFENALKEQEDTLQRKVQDVKENLEVEYQKQNLERINQLNELTTRVLATEMAYFSNMNYLMYALNVSKFAIAVLNFKKILKTNAPILIQYNQLREAAEQDEFVQILLHSIPDECLKDGVPKVSDLIQLFETKRKAALSASLTASNGLFARLMSDLLSLLIIPDEGLVAGDTTNATLSRALYYLKKDQLQKAMVEVEKLDEKPKQELRTWIKKAQVRAHAETVSDALENHLINLYQVQNKHRSNVKAE